MSAQRRRKHRDQMQSPGQHAPIFLVSVRYRQELTSAIEATGRLAVAARRPDEAVSRFAQLPSSIAVIDARGALGHGLRVARELAAAVASRCGAMLFLLSRADADALSEVYDAGATHFLISPFGCGELAQALRFADRYIGRMQASGASGAMAGAQARLTDSARWRWTRGTRVVTVSPALASMLGLPRSELVDVMPILRRLGRSERVKLLQGLRRLLAAGAGGDVELAMPIDGTPHKVVHHVRLLHDDDGSVVGLTATVEDLEAVMLDRRLSAHFDQLTGLANQAHARAWIDQMLGGRAAFDPACIVVLMAISRFDQINASYGRSVADALLQAVGRRLRRLAGAEEGYGERVLIARLAGAEFMVGFAGPVVLQDAVFFGQRLGVAFDRPFVVGGRVIHLACRMGIAVGDRDLDGAETLFRRASAALAEAKGQEPNSFQVFLAGEGEDAHERMASLETDLRRALEADELDIVYQPQVELAAERITGVEALVRWRHPILGLLPAGTLLDVATSAELTVRLSEHILNKALGEAAAWGGSLDHLQLSVNITAEDMRVDDFDHMVVEALGRSGFPAERLTLEVTESGLMENLDNAASVLEALRGRGVKVAIDDFGTGYSSLAYLKSLPLDYLKIDRKLVTDAVGSERGRVVMRGVIEMAHSLDIGVVAEGVETPEQLDMLRREGVSWYQGFLCAQPMAGSELAAFVAAWQDRLVAA